MASYSTSLTHRHMKIWYFLFYMFLVFLLNLNGCGSDPSVQETADRPSTASADTGSASFAIQWHMASVQRASDVVRQAIENCESADVASITCDVYDESNNPLASGGPWPCDAHGGRIEGIPAGINRTLYILGWSGDGNIVYQGQTENSITIAPGSIADGGTIDAYPFIPTLYNPTNNAQVDPTDVSLEWELIENASEYLVQVAENETFETIVIDETTPDTIFPLSTLEPSKKYFWKISAIDIHDNLGAESEVRSFVTFVEHEAPVISGYILRSDETGIGGVTVSFSNSGGSVTTNSSGYYSNTVPYGWSGSVTPSLNGYNFRPPSNSYNNVTADQSNKNFTGTPISPVISGYILRPDETGIGGVTVAFSNNGGSVTTNSSGYYSNTVPYGWSGSVTPSLNGYNFSPPSNSYNNVTADQSNKNFTGTLFPDYTITELSVSPIETTVDVTAAIANQGGSPTTCIAIGIYLSSDATITTSDTRLEYWELKPCNLDPDETYKWTMSVTIPQNIYYDSYYIGIIVDVDQSETESNESNNTDAQYVSIYYQQ